MTDGSCSQLAVQTGVHTAIAVCRPMPGAASMADLVV